MKPLVVFIVGATATGKSDFAIEVCERLAPAEIINSDSIQFFDGVEIGAAKPLAKDLARARHHLIGHVPKAAEYNAGDFRRDALKVIETNATPRWLVVGGSGFYVQALEKGMYDVPEVAPEIRAQLEREGEAPGGFMKLHAELAARDPESAAKIHAADRYRILRALELLRTYPETLSAIRAKFAATSAPAPFTAVKLGLAIPRELQRERIRLRTEKMLADGLIDEVERLRAEGLAAWAPLKSVGYKEVQDMLEGRLKREALLEQIVVSTHQLAKRQMTWFKRDPSITWFNPLQGFAAPMTHLSQIFDKFDADAESRDGLAID